MRPRRPSGGKLPVVEVDPGSSWGLFGLFVASAAALVFACYWLFVPYGTHPIDGGTVTVNWAFSSIDRQTDRIGDQLSILPEKDAFGVRPWVRVPNERVSLTPSSASCLKPEPVRKSGGRWLIVLHPQERCDAWPLILKMPDARTKGRHFRDWVQFAAYAVEERAPSSDAQPLSVSATFRAPEATSILTHELSTLVYSAYSSPVSSSEYRCTTIDGSADVAQVATCTASVENHPGNLQTINLPGWSYRFEAPSYTPVSIAVPAFLSAVFGATISGLPPFVPWRPRRKA
jgi:hypothetical protein